MSDKTLLKRLSDTVKTSNTSIGSTIRKDNLTDVASQISNQSGSPQSQSSGGSQPQNLGSNQVVGTDGTVIDLGINSQDIVKK